MEGAKGHHALSADPLVTTDLAVAATTLLTVFCADRYLRNPSAWRWAFLGIALGSVLASKHTGVFVPLIVLLQFAMFAWFARKSVLGRKFAHFGAARIGACVIGVGILCCTYQFRYSALPARPEGFHIAQILHHDGRAQTLVGKVIAGTAKLHLLPKSGLLYVVDNSVRTSYIFRKENQ